ncbi:uncharacterized protein KY384_007043 [Bacidia gigantensis]|uniref:uncharacterized protein n=1 Tax=Bacidia gigantensis TaxID=2732470 RepID=UPI001D03D19F|nr:uncharacterized protein KY384_007043 [Bacidia gigantensis]KAG8528127.1 hypothetical protein KY384_007043 [Bacidia gigantensis]
MRWSFSTSILPALLFLFLRSSTSIPLDLPAIKNSTISTSLAVDPSRHIDPLIVNVLITETALNISEEFDPYTPRYMPIAPFPAFANAWCDHAREMVNAAGGLDEPWNGPQFTWDWQDFHVTYVPGDYLGATYGDLSTVAITVRGRIEHFRDDDFYREVEVFVERMFELESNVLAVIDVWHDQPGVQEKPGWLGIGASGNGSASAGQAPVVGSVNTS